MHYDFATVDGIKVGGSQPLRKLARLARRKAEAEKVGVKLTVWLRMKPEKRAHLLRAARSAEKAGLSMATFKAYAYLYLRGLWPRRDGFSMPQESAA